MKQHFFEYYDTLSDDDKKEIFQNCLFVFDTNVILNLYRYTADTRDKMLSIMEKYRERIWMPYQVGWEFFNNREEVINKVRNGCNAISKHIKDDKNGLFKILDDNYKRHPYIDKKEIRQLVEDSLKPVFDRLEELNKEDPNYLQNDIVWNRLTTLFEDHLGDDYDDEVLNQIYKEGSIRYMHSIPPGYEDLKTKKDKAPRHLYGDLIVWKQTIDIAEKRGMDVVFISDDQKEDWYEKTERNEEKRPRRELIKEFGVKTKGKNILLYNQDGFLHYIDEYLGDKVESKVVEEVKEVAEQEARNLEERRRLTQEILTKAGYLGNASAFASRPVQPFDISLLSHYRSPFEAISGGTYSQIEQLCKPNVIIPTGVEATLSAMTSVGDVMASGETQSAITALSGINQNAAEQIKKLTAGFNPEAIAATQTWFEKLKQMPKIPKYPWLNEE